LHAVVRLGIPHSAPLTPGCASYAACGGKKVVTVVRPVYGDIHEPQAQPWGSGHDLGPR
jgi:hypothetical protein